MLHRKDQPYSKWARRGTVFDCGESEILATNDSYEEVGKDRKGSVSVEEFVD